MFTKNYDNFDADFYFDKVTDITPYTVRKMGVKALAIDLDNTMLPYGGYHIEDSAREWAEISMAIELLFVRFCCGDYILTDSVAFFYLFLISVSHQL